MKRVLALVVIAVMAAGATPAAQNADARLEAQKKEAVRAVDEMAKLAQEMVDSVFSFGELGMQEVETSRYLTAQLEKFGFKVTRGQSGIPTAWVADRKSTRLNSSHLVISYAVFCLKKKIQHKHDVETQ